MHIKISGPLPVSLFNTCGAFCTIYRTGEVILFNEDWQPLHIKRVFECLVSRGFGPETCGQHAVSFVPYATLFWLSLLGMTYSQTNFDNSIASQSITTEYDPVGSDPQCPAWAAGVSKGCCKGSSDQEIDRVLHMNFSSWQDGERKVCGRPLFPVFVITVNICCLLVASCIHAAPLVWSTHCGPIDCWLCVSTWQWSWLLACTVIPLASRPSGYHTGMWFWSEKQNWLWICKERREVYTPMQKVEQQPVNYFSINLNKHKLFLV